MYYFNQHSLTLHCPFASLTPPHLPFLLPLKMVREDVRLPGSTDGRLTPAS